MKKNNKKLGGQLLIESLVGISIVTVGLLGVVGLVSRSLSLNRVISDKFTASYLSLEGIEIVRNLLDANIIQEESWNKGFQTDGDYSVYYDSNELILGGNKPLYLKNGFYGADGGELTPFKRTIHVTPSPKGDDNEIQVNSIVKWTTRGGGAFKVDNEYHFYNWR